MTTPTRNLQTSSPTDAVDIIDTLVGRMRADGLSVSEVVALGNSLHTLRTFVASALKPVEPGALKPVEPAP